MTDFSKSWLDLPPPPPVTAMYEMVLEVADLAASEQFYMEAIGLPRGRAADFRAYWRIDPYFRDL